LCQSNPFKLGRLFILLFCFASNVFAGNSVKTFQNQNYGYIENKGQLINQDYEANSQVLYFLSAKGVNVHLKQNGFSLEMVQQVDSSNVKFHRIDAVFEGANTNCVLEPSQKASGYINYYLNYTKEQGVPAGKGQTHVAHYGKITYKDIYPGIDIEFMLDPKVEGVGYKYNVVVNPGASLSQVRLKVLGAQDLKLNDKGNLVYSTSLGNIEESIPYSYIQTKEGSKQEAKVLYDLHSKESFGFSSNTNTNENKLVIDPIGWATYFWGGR
jgi:hypothetical protein